MNSDDFHRLVERRNRVIGRIRIGALNKLYAYRYRGRREDYVFTEDDAGLEDLKILLHHYALNNPLAVPRIIKLRAPWADPQKLQEEIGTYPRKWRSKKLGQILRFTAAEWRVLRIPTISPIDMTKEERRQDSQIRHRQRMRTERKRAGVQSRTQYLEANHLSRTQPWLTEGGLGESEESGLAEPSRALFQACSYGPMSEAEFLGYAGDAGWLLMRHDAQHEKHNVRAATTKHDDPEIRTGPRAYQVASRQVLWPCAASFVPPGNRHSGY